ncbi:MAG: hypothetical protein ABI574_00945 [Burkholderiales bacterium]
MALDALDFGVSNASRYFTFTGPGLPAGDWTIGFWTRRTTDAGSGFQYMVSRGTLGGNNSLQVFTGEASAGNNGDVILRALGSSGTEFNDGPVAVLPLATTTDKLVVVQRRSSQIEVYCVSEGATVSAPNGTYTTNVPNAISSGTWYIGGRSDLDATRFWEAPLGEFFILTSDSLTAAEVQTLAAGVHIDAIRSGASAPAVDLRFRGNNATESDLSGNSRNATRNGTTGYALVTEFFPNTLAPTIVTPPEWAAAAVGATATFSVSATASAGSLTYQWAYSADGSSWSDISGATSSSYTTPTIVSGDHGGFYRAAVTDSNATVTAGPARLMLTGLSSAGKGAAFVGWARNMRSWSSLPTGRLTRAAINPLDPNKDDGDIWSSWYGLATAATSIALNGSGQASATSSAGLTAAAAAAGAGAAGGAASAAITSLAILSGTGGHTSSATATLSSGTSLTGSGSVQGAGTGAVTTRALPAGSGALSGASSASLSVAQALAGTGACSSASSAALVAYASLASSSAATVRASASLTIAVAIVGSGSSAGASSASLTQQMLFSSVSAATARSGANEVATYAALGGSGRVSGAVGAADITISYPDALMTSVSRGVAASSGSLVTVAQPAGSGSGPASAAAPLTVLSILASGATGVARQAASLTTSAVLASTSSVTGVATASLTVAGALVAAGVGPGAASGGISAVAILAAQASVETTTSLVGFASDAALVSFASATGSATAATVVVAELTGFGGGSGEASASIATIAVLASAAAGPAASTAALDAGSSLASFASVAGSSAAAISTAAAITGFGGASSEAIASISSVAVLTSAAAGGTASAATLNSESPLTSSCAATASASASLSASTVLTGAAAVSARASAELSSASVLAAQAIAMAQAMAEIASSASLASDSRGAGGAAAQLTPGGLFVSLVGSGGVSMRSDSTLSAYVGLASFAVARAMATSSLQVAAFLDGQGQLDNHCEPAPLGQQGAHANNVSLCTSASFDLVATTAVAGVQVLGIEAAAAVGLAVAA